MPSHQKLYHKDWPIPHRQEVKDRFPMHAITGHISPKLKKRRLTPIYRSQYDAAPLPYENKTLYANYANYYDGPLSPMKNRENDINLNQQPAADVIIYRPSDAGLNPQTVTEQNIYEPREADFTLQTSTEANNNGPSETGLNEQNISVPSKAGLDSQTSTVHCIGKPQLLFREYYIDPSAMIMGYSSPNTQISGQYCKPINDDPKRIPCLTPFIKQTRRSFKHQPSNRNKFFYRPQNCCECPNQKSTRNKYQEPEIKRNHQKRHLKNHRNRQFDSRLNSSTVQNPEAFPNICQDKRTNFKEQSISTSIFQPIVTTTSTSCTDCCQQKEIEPCQTCPQAIGAIATDPMGVSTNEYCPPPIRKCSSKKSKVSICSQPPQTYEYPLDSFANQNPEACKNFCHADQKNPNHFVSDTSAQKEILQKDLNDAQIQENIKIEHDIYRDWNDTEKQKSEKETNDSSCSTGIMPHSKEPITESEDKKPIITNDVACTCTIISLNVKKESCCQPKVNPTTGSSLKNNENEIKEPLPTCNCSTSCCLIDKERSKLNKQSLGVVTSSHKEIVTSTSTSCSLCQQNIAEPGHQVGSQAIPPIPTEGSTNEGPAPTSRSYSDKSKDLNGSQPLTSSLRKTHHPEENTITSDQTNKDVSVLHFRERPDDLKVKKRKNKACTCDSSTGSFEIAPAKKKEKDKPCTCESSKNSFKIDPANKKKKTEACSCDSTTSSFKLVPKNKKKKHEPCTCDSTTSSFKIVPTKSTSASSNATFNTATGSVSNSSMKMNKKTKNVSCLCLETESCLCFKNISCICPDDTNNSVNKTKNAKEKDKGDSTCNTCTSCIADKPKKMFKKRKKQQQSSCPNLTCNRCTSCISNTSQNENQRDVQVLKEKNTSTAHSYNNGHNEKQSEVQVFREQGTSTPYSNNNGHNENQSNVQVSKEQETSMAYSNNNGHNENQSDGHVSKEQKNTMAYSDNNHHNGNQGDVQVSKEHETSSAYSNSNRHNDTKRLADKKKKRKTSNEIQSIHGDSNKYHAKCFLDTSNEKNKKLRHQKQSSKKHSDVNPNDRRKSSLAECSKVNNNETMVKEEDTTDTSASLILDNSNEKNGKHRSQKQSLDRRSDVTGNDHCKICLAECSKDNKNETMITEEETMIKKEEKMIKEEDTSDTSASLGCSCCSSCVSSTSEQEDKICDNVKEETNVYRNVKDFGTLTCSCGSKPGKFSNCVIH